MCIPIFHKNLCAGNDPSICFSLPGTSDISMFLMKSIIIPGSK